MKDDSNKDLLMMSLVQSLCLGQLPKEGDTDDQFTLVEELLSINDIGEDSSRAGENPISRIGIT
jgi:hypothetical protein